jgi:hypothetical protein
MRRRVTRSILEQTYLRVAWISITYVTVLSELQEPPVREHDSRQAWRDGYTAPSFVPPPMHWYTRSSATPWYICASTRASQELRASNAASAKDTLMVGPRGLHEPGVRATRTLTHPSHQPHMHTHTDSSSPLQLLGITHSSNPSAKNGLPPRSWLSCTSSNKQYIYK